LKILIVDKDRETQLQLQVWLREWSHDVSEARDTTSAQDLLDASWFDIVLLNWSQTGPELCQYVRQGATYRYLLAYTADLSEAGIKACMDADVDDVVGTPFAPASLRVRVLAAERMLNLQRAFTEQQTVHKALNEKLDTAYQTLHSELIAASELQLSLLPTVSDIHPRLALEWLVLPSSFLAGDNLNYFMMQDRYLIFYQLDVAGHGIPSALLSVTLNQLLSPQPGSPMVRFDPKLELKRIVPPVDVVSELNRRFQPQGDGYFTIIYAVLDTKTREIRMCQAGHPSPIKLNAEGEISTVGTGGFPVGLWPDMTYDETRARLLPGERLVLYTDGILACLNDQDVAYSLGQLENVIRQTRELPLKQVLEAVKFDLEKWTQGRDFPDDISILIVESK